MAQKIAIPDHKFEEALVKIGIDSEIDGFLNIDKAKAVDTLELSTMMISDLTGIEAFTELKYLSCGQNLIKKIDLSKNTKLRAYLVVILLISCMNLVMILWIIGLMKI